METPRWSGLRPDAATSERSAGRMTRSFSHRDYTRRIRVERRRERGRHERWTELGDWLAWAPDESLVFREPPLPFKSWRTWCRDNGAQGNV